VSAVLRSRPRLHQRVERGTTYDLACARLLAPVPLHEAVLRLATWWSVCEWGSSLEGRRVRCGAARSAGAVRRSFAVRHRGSVARGEPRDLRTCGRPGRRRRELSEVLEDDREVAGPGPSRGVCPAQRTHQASARLNSGHSPTNRGYANRARRDAHLHNNR
jgi:hypothetical protein